MIVTLWVVVDRDGNVSATARPMTPHRLEALRQDRCQVHQAYVDLGAALKQSIFPAPELDLGSADPPRSERLTLPDLEVAS